VAALPRGQCCPATRKRETVIRIFRGDPLELLLREWAVELNHLEKLARLRPIGHGEGAQGSTTPVPVRMRRLHKNLCPEPSCSSKAYWGLIILTWVIGIPLPPEWPGAAKTAHAVQCRP
jgi:hypothetical protein